MNVPRSHQNICGAKPCKKMTDYVADQETVKTHQHTFPDFTLFVVTLIIGNKAAQWEEMKGRRGRCMCG
jgi:hypothetical protein